MRRAQAGWLVMAVAVAANLVGSGGCSHDPRIDERAVVVYSSRFCPVTEDKAYAAIYACGDFEPRIERPPTAALYLRDRGFALEDFPEETRSIVVDVSQGEADWRGLAEVPNAGPVNVFVWPGGQACRLSRDV